ncbi:MAG TPA: class I SAM-dependent methyltransferase [Vicinamibacteria bacterium]|nr:class I SAM-dependent methyltransferase [Vicinamibacteria bacterium]
MATVSYEPVARLVPLTPVVDLTTRRGQIRFRSDVRDSAGHVFAVDLYSHLRERHPETHLGYWVFPLPEGRAETTIGIDLSRIGPDSLWRETPAGRAPALDSWSNPDYVFDPIVGIQLVLRRDGRVIENRFVTGRVADPEVLRSYYHRVHAQHGYTPAEPFLFELHAAMLRRLERLFLAHFPPRSRVLDAGCGRSLFTEIRPDWPFSIVAADVDHDLLASRRAEFPAVRWVVGQAHPLPFRDGAFDGLFAGELVEHLADPAAGIDEFRRVLRPGGALVLTTPNRRRLANVVDGSERPYSPDHLSELSYDEVGALLGAHGFEVTASTGVHLELLLNWLSPLPKLDRLQRRWNRRWAVPLMRVLLAAGALAPRYALDLVFVARRA